MPTLHQTEPAQIEPEELAQSLRYSIARLARLLRQQDRNGHGPTLTAALASVARLDGPTHGELAATEQVAPPTITAVVSKMEVLGLVTREPDPSDRRITRIRITPAGLAELEDVRSRRTEWLGEQVRGLTADEYSRLAAAVDVVAKLTEAPTTHSREAVPS
ncbi:MAG: transcriptional regulator, MarR family [Acidimicrobiales bacterium]|nr:transcriptional regulator, MarR family [Acidimicrobiales bacterium]